MERLQGYKFELMPNGEQQRQMRRFAGSRRFVFNKALALQKERREMGEKHLGYVPMAKLLTGWRGETPWLADAPVHPLQHALKDLDRAYRNFFEGRADFPRFKKKGQSESFRYPDPKQFRLEQGNGRIFLPKLGWLRYRSSREVEGQLRNVTVSLSGGKYFVSIQTRRDVPEPIHPSTSVVGIDVGIARFATLSDGAVIEPLNSFKKHQQRLKRYQRAMARKVKFSNNWKKAKAKVARVATHAANARRDFLHKTSTTISQNHAVVCVEALVVKNMCRSAKGTIEAPGNNVRAKSGLNRAILDQGWSSVSHHAGIQTGMGGRQIGRRAAAPHQPGVPRVPSRFGGQPAHAGVVRLRGMRVRKQRRSGRRDQCVRARISLVSLWRDGAIRPLDEAGTLRSCSGGLCLRAVGIPAFHAGRMSI